MAIKPILFHTEMARSIREDWKTETRRLIEPHYRDDECGLQIVTKAVTGEFVRVEVIDENEQCTRYLQPKYMVGDILWVRENWAIGEDGDFVYMADYPDHELTELRKKHFRWRPSIHMPQEAAREFLQITAVRAEALRSITAAGVRAEGITTDAAIRGDPQGRIDFKWAWNSTIPKSKLSTCGWSANPWVWVYRFQRCDKPKAF